MTCIYPIHNLHHESCGEPPKIQKPENGYFSYYENKYGEQWFVVGDYDSMTMTLTGGDVDWTQFSIDWDTIYFCDCVLNPLERAWLDSCIYTFFTLKHSEPEIKENMAKIRRRYRSRAKTKLQKLLASLT